MLELNLYGANWQTADDFYDAFLDAVGAPQWHGRNLDALQDSIMSGGINEIEAPYKIVISGMRSMAAPAREMVERFQDLIRGADGFGCGIELNYSD